MGTVVTSGVRAADTWVPVSDDAHIAVDAAGVASGDLPLLGAESTLLENLSDIRPIHHLGPAETYVLGLWQLVQPGSAGLLVAALGIACAAGVTSILAARAIAGVMGTVLTGTLCALTASRLGTPILADIWNPYVPILPLLAAALSGMAFAVVRWRPGLPLAVVFGSFAAQAHLTNGAVLAATLLPAVGVGLVDRRRRSDLGLTPTTRWPRSAALAVGVAVWMPPLISEVVAGPSNVVNLVSGIRGRPDEAFLGIGHALQALRTTIATPPPWAPPVAVRTLWPTGPSSVATDLGWWLLAVTPLVVLTVWALRTRAWRWSALGGGVLLGELAALVLLTTSTYSSGFASYQTRWLWALATLHWSATGLLALAWGRGVPPVGRTPRGKPRGGRRFAPAPVLGLKGPVTAIMLIVAVAASVATLAPPAGTRSYPPDLRHRMETVKELAPSTVDFAAEHDGTQLVVMTGPQQPGVSLDLAAQVLLADEEIAIASPEAHVRDSFGRGRTASEATGPQVQVAPVAETAAMRRRGFSLLGRTAPLAAIERHRLEQLRFDIRADYGRADPRWSPYGALVHFGQDLDVNELLAENTLENAAFRDHIEGWDPDASELRELSELQRRSEQHAIAVWWRRGR